MFRLALILGLYAYSIFFLGLLGFLTREYLFVDTVVFSLVTLFSFKNVHFGRNAESFVLSVKKDRFSTILLGLLVLQASVNLIGALGPELSFDALWYHLTLPKMYLANHTVSFIPGNLLYYSAMPQLTEMYYVVALAFHDEIAAKVIHFLFGILTCAALYLFAKQIVKKEQAAFLSIVIFYANLVVGWESITAFSDLSRTFFELLSLWAFMKWSERGILRWLIISAVLLGFAIAAKLLALGSLGIFIVLITIRDFRDIGVVRVVREALVYAGVALLVASPWLVFAYVNTGNPLYPFFSQLHLIQITHSLFNPFMFITETWKLFVTADDPIVPIYLIVLPLLYVVRKKITFSIRLLLIYSLLAFLSWYLLPKIGGGRFIMPYLPAYSILAAFIITSLAKGLLRSFQIAVVVVVALTSIFYRGAANTRYLPVLSGIESKERFLTMHLNYSFGDFYDTDGYFASNIKQSDIVLLYGFHNLYYVNFPFIHESFLKKGNTFNFIAVQHGKLPKKHSGAKLIYKNPLTDVKLYKLKNTVTYD